MADFRPAFVQVTGSTLMYRMPMRTSLLLLFLMAGALAAQPRFRVQEIQRDFGVVYAVLAEDVNGDGRTDVVAINPTQVAWFENPSWTKHVILDGATKKDNVCIAAHDIDGDGKLDFALGADWQPTNTASGGSLQWIRHGAAPWQMFPLGEEPTLHRIRWGDVDGDGRKELVVAPLHGRRNKAPDWEGQGVRMLVMRPGPDPTKPWTTEVADDSLHIVHNFIIEHGAILTASREGVHALRRDGAGRWSRTKLGDGAPGEIKLGHVNRIRHLATVEPWHGNSIVIYQEPTQTPDPQGPPQANPVAIANQLWKREVIDSSLNQAHALGWGDFDGDGSDELAAGWRGKPYGVALYKRSPTGTWQKTMVDDAMAAEDLAVADLNGDGRPEIIAVGRATANVRIYWNETASIWPRHVITTGFRNQTAIAADFTGDGRPDVITNDITGRRTILYAAPDWKQTVLHTGVNAIHSEVMDVDGDGDLDFIGARYTPGLIFWLQRPKDPLREPWPYHVIDEFEKGGVNGIHGLIRGDVDRDGKLDLIANSAQPTGNFPHSLAWFRVPANPRAPWQRFVFAEKDAPGLSHYMGFGDVNGDGRPDIASAAKVADGGNWFAWWEQPASGGGAWKKHLIATGQEGATNIHMADVNGDGKTDFIASRGHGRGLVWYEAPNWTAHEINDKLLGPHSLAIGDIDGDGDIDLVTCAKDSRIAAWFENDGKGNFTTHHIHENQAAYDIRLVDMDRDGDLDVLIAGQESQNVVWYENKRR
ncbi:MAG: VCBS repeat-containing protein [Acidimicrobiia bacterium]|nr:VCBS repeat-containing protein [Acidimicrobiia bacterium]